MFFILQNSEDGPQYCETDSKWKEIPFSPIYSRSRNTSEFEFDESSTGALQSEDHVDASSGNFPVTVPKSEEDLKTSVNNQGLKKDKLVSMDSSLSADEKDLSDEHKTKEHSGISSLGLAETSQQQRRKTNQQRLARTDSADSKNKFNSVDDGVLSIYSALKRTYEDAREQSVGTEKPIANDEEFVCIGDIEEVDLSALEETIVEGTSIEGTSKEGTSNEGTRMEGTSKEGKSMEGKLDDKNTFLDESWGETSASEHDSRIPQSRKSSDFVNFKSENVLGDVDANMISGVLSPDIGIHEQNIVDEACMVNRTGVITKPLEFDAKSEVPYSTEDRNAIQDHVTRIEADSPVNPVEGLPGNMEQTFAEMNKLYETVDNKMVEKTDGKKEFFPQISTQDPVKDIQLTDVLDEEENICPVCDTRPKEAFSQISDDNYIAGSIHVFSDKPIEQASLIENSGGLQSEEKQNESPCLSGAMNMNVSQTPELSDRLMERPDGKWESSLEGKQLGQDNDQPNNFDQESIDLESKQSILDLVNHSNHITGTSDDTNHDLNQNKSNFDQSDHTTDISDQVKHDLESNTPLDYAKISLNHPVITFDFPETSQQGRNINGRVSRSGNQEPNQETNQEPSQQTDQQTNQQTDQQTDQEAKQDINQLFIENGTALCETVSLGTGMDALLKAKASALELKRYSMPNTSLPFETAALPIRRDPDWSIDASVANASDVDAGDHLSLKRGSLPDVTRDRMLRRLSSLSSASDHLAFQELMASDLLDLRNKKLKATIASLYEESGSFSVLVVSQIDYFLSISVHFL